ncbi:hypothetical protein GCM10028784_32030 [Myceligenerans cantabricum]
MPSSIRSTAVVRTLLAFVLAFGIGIPLQAVSTTDLAYAAGCVGSSCHLKSPTGQNCTDNRTISSFTATQGAGSGTVVELRWSTTCKAYWVRGSSPAGGYYCNSAVKLNWYDSSKHYLGSVYQGIGCGTGWTNMAHRGKYIKWCSASFSGTAAEQCSGFRQTAWTR